MSTSGSEQIRSYFNNCSSEASDLLDQIIKLSKTRGQYSEAPMIAPPAGIEYTKKTGLVNDFFGNPKPLNATEITNLWFNLKKTALAKSAALAFGQYAKNKEVRQFCKQIIEDFEQYFRDLSDILANDHLPSPRTWDSDITSSTVSPFSDKLMMFHMGFKLSTAIAYYGSGLASSQRADLVTAYSKLIMGVLKTADDWLAIMVRNEWLEKQPEAVDRKALVQR